MFLVTSQSINPGSEMLVIAKFHIHWKSTNVDQEAIIGTLRQASSARVGVGKILRTLTLLKKYRL